MDSDFGTRFSGSRRSGDILTPTVKSEKLPSRFMRKLSGVAAVRKIA